MGAWPFGRRSNGAKEDTAFEKKKRLRRHVKRKEYDLALKTGLELLKIQPDENDVLFIVGTILHTKGSHGEAIHYLSRALEIATYDSEALILKARSHLKLNQTAEAKACYRKVLEVDPKNREAAGML